MPPSIKNKQIDKYNELLKQAKRTETAQFLKELHEEDSRSTEMRSEELNNIDNFKTLTYFVKFMRQKLLYSNLYFGCCALVFFK